MILDLLTSGSLTLTSVRLLGRHLTPENHQAVISLRCWRHNQYEAEQVFGPRLSVSRQQRE